MTKRKTHVVEYVKSGGHSDQYKCSCGWLSNGYWDLVEAAFDEWLVHAYDVGQEVRSTFMERQSKLIQERTQKLARLEGYKARLNKQIAAIKPKKTAKKKAKKK